MQLFKTLISFISIIFYGRYFSSVFWNKNIQDFGTIYLICEQNFNTAKWNSIVIVQLCQMHSHMDIYLCFQLTRCVEMLGYLVYVFHNGEHRTTAIIRLIVYDFNNGLMGNRLHCRIRQITSITNTTVARVVFTT